MDPEVVGLGVVRRPPHGGQQLGLADQPAAAAGEHLDDPPLGRRQVDLLAVAGGAGVGDVEAQPVDLDDQVGLLAARPARGGADPRQQLLDRERLGDEVVGTEVERLDLVVGLGARRDHDHRHLGEGPQLRQHRDAVEVGQAEVEQDHVGHPLVDDLQRRPAVARRLDVVVAGPQVDRQRAPHRGVVVDDQHERHRASSAAGCVASSSTNVSPPPGVSSVAIVPPIASVQPVRHGQAEPDAVLLRHVAEPLERREQPRPGRGRATPGPVSAIRSDDPVAGRQPRRCARGRRPGVYFSAFSQMLASTRSSSPASASTTQRRGRRRPRSARRRAAARCSRGRRRRGRPRRSDDASPNRC